MRAVVLASSQPSWSLRARETLARCLEIGLTRCPVLAVAITMLLTGAGMVLAVTAATAFCVLPLGLVMGWLLK